MNTSTYKGWPVGVEVGLNCLTRAPALSFLNIPRRVSHGVQDYILRIHESKRYRLVARPSFITALPEAPYSLRVPIPILLEALESGGWIATFDEANIAMIGETPEEAKELLSYNIVDAIELFYSHEEALVPDLRQTLEILLRYIEPST